ncbi:MAG TPA: hypothetical protein VJ044_05015 [Candidatus Hodarchaeales archaeon]|nr:hypothetical protein [Candidatus Hodarchaeales archaeon]
MDVLTIQLGWIGGKKLGVIPPPQQVKTGGRGVTYRFIDDLNDDEDVSLLLVIMELFD